MTKNHNKPTLTAINGLSRLPENMLIEDMNQPLSEDLISLLSQAQAHEKWPIAQLISIFERNTDENFITRHKIVSYLNEHPQTFTKQALVLGVTGTPGAGKSSLIGETCLSLLAKNPSLSIAVLAIDPSSHESGGALLGDRTRTIFPIKDKPGREKDDKLASFILKLHQDPDATVAKLESDILKVGHHGSRSSSSENFLKDVAPELTVIQVGEGNPYHHPHISVVDRLNDLSIPVLRNDLHGDIEIISDGFYYTVDDTNDYND